MTTTTTNRDIIANIADTRRVIDQARAEGRVVRGETLNWREQALERAGDLFLAGFYAESREHALKAREE